MDELPDELLMSILGHVDDGRTLLDAVPLVCKRWHRLSREREAWAGVVVRVERCFELLFGYVDGPDEVPFDDSTSDGLNHAQMMLAARVMLHAPFVRRLEIMSPDRDCSLEPRFFCAALRRSGAAVGELRLDGLPYRHLDVVCELLARSQGSLRVLDVNELQLTESLQLAVSHCSGLEWLTLQVEDAMSLNGLPGFTYAAGSLRGALPNLRRLTLKDEWDRPVVVALLVDLIRGAAASLRQLDLTRRLPLAVAAEVRCCEGLESLTCDAADVGLLPALPRLRRLSLSTRDLKHPNSVAAAASALFGPGPLLPSLRGLSIELNCIKTADQLQELGALVDALESVATDVVHATLKCPWYEPFPFVGLLLRMRRLRSLSLPWCASPQALEVAADLPELKHLHARLGNRMNLDEKEAHCRAAIEAFRRDRPDVGGKLTTWNSHDQLNESL